MSDYRLPDPAGDYYAHLGKLSEPTKLAPDVPDKETVMSPKIVAEILLAHTQNAQYGAERSAAGETPEHAVWMLNQVADCEVVGEKAHRWIGYAQGLLVVGGVVSLEDCKSINKSA